MFLFLFPMMAISNIVNVLVVQTRGLPSVGPGHAPMLQDLGGRINHRSAGGLGVSQQAGSGARMGTLISSP